MISAFAASLLLGIGSTAGAQTISSDILSPAKDRLTIKSDFELASSPVKQVKIKKISENTEPAPKTLVGNSYVVLYTYNGEENNGFFKAVEDSVPGQLILEGFAEGYDVKATYNASIGKITIAAKGAVIDTHSTYGDIHLYALSGNNYYEDVDITGSWDGEKFVFDYGLYGKVQAGGLVVMTDVTANIPSGEWSFTLSGDSFSFPLLVTKTDKDKISVIGMSSLYYGARVPVAFTLDESAGTATVPFKTTVDKSNTTTYILGGLTDGYLTDLEMKVTATDSISTLTAPVIFYGYNKSGTSYSGLQCLSSTIKVDFNVFTAESAPVDNENPEIGGIKYYTPAGATTAEVVGCDDNLTDLNIPAEIEVNGVKYPVTAVRGAAFQANRKITSITIPASIDTIGQDAFRNVSNAKTINIADLKAWCAVKIANGNANPIYNAFPTSERNWGKVFIEGEQVSTSLTVPEGVTSLLRSFYGFKSLTQITLPESLKEIGDQSFCNCEKLTEVTIPAKVTKMGSAFMNCKALKKVTFLGDSIRELGNYTFYYCDLDTITLSPVLESMGNSTFSNNTKLTGITLPATLKKMGYMVFSGCSGLKSIVSYAVEPPVCGSMVFDDVDTSIPVYVPQNSVEAYKAANEWNNFTNYQVESSAVEAIEEEDSNNTKVEYFNLNGVRVDNPSNGIFIRRQGGKVSKEVIK